MQFLGAVASKTPGGGLWALKLGRVGTDHVPALSACAGNLMGFCRSEESGKPLSHCVVGRLWA